jgi:L-ribulose-5-phosphate 3-epimerase UlaE
MKDCLFRFVIPAKNDTLLTQDKQEAINRSSVLGTGCSGNYEMFCNVLYILNKCGHIFVEMRTRHNRIKEKLKEAVIKHRKIREDEIILGSRVDAGINFGLEGFSMEEFRLF